MDQNQLLQAVYDHFFEVGDWPAIRKLQVAHLRSANIRALAAEIGRDRIVCQDGPDGLCLLRLPAIAQLPNSQEDMEHFIAAVRLLARHYIQFGSTPFTSESLSSALRLSTIQLRRLGALFCTEGPLVRSFTWPSEHDPAFSVTPSERAMFFEDVKTYAEYCDVLEDLTGKERATSMRLAEEYRKVRGILVPEISEYRAEPREPRYRLADPTLDAIFQRDLVELHTVVGVGAWKASAILAGMLVESLLLDVWMRHEEVARERFGNQWPSQVTASAMAARAATERYIPEHHRELASVMRRWRNLVHPLTALRSDEPTEELANLLVAGLDLLMGDLTRQAWYPMATTS